MTVVYQTKTPSKKAKKYRVEYRTPDHGWWSATNLLSASTSNNLLWLTFKTWLDSKLMSAENWEFRIIDTKEDEDNLA